MERLEIKTGTTGRGKPFFLSSDGLQWIVDRGVGKGSKQSFFHNLESAFTFITMSVLMEQDFKTLADIRREILRLEDFFAEKLNVKIEGWDNAK